MNDRRPTGSSMSRGEALKAAVTIIGLLFACIALGWVVTRVLHAPQPPNPPANAGPAR